MILEAAEPYVKVKTNVGTLVCVWLLGASSVVKRSETVTRVMPISQVYRLPDSANHKSRVTACLASYRLIADVVSATCAVSKVGS